MKHLLSLDLDGSLLNKKGNLSEKTIKVLTMLKKEGHFIVLATGRPFTGAYPKYLEIGLDTPLVTDNGGSIENPNDPNFARQRTYIPTKMMHELFTFSKSFILSSFFSIDEIVYAYQYDKKLEEFFSGIHSDRVIDDEFTNFNVEPTGLMFFIHYNKQEIFEDFIDKNFGHTLSYRLWDNDEKIGHAVYEVYLKHVSKASAIKYIKEHYELNDYKWLSIGDGVNDFEMIKDADFGVAMINSVPELKEVCKDVTVDDHDHDGVANFFIKYFDLQVNE
jgi:Cof subfamily protein (haloacid dehalogenase superfamily)